jgi:hypothetical protein
LNFIELIWGWLKSHLRRHCHFDFKRLKEQLPRAMLDEMPIAFVRRAFRKCQRFMSGYRIGLEGPLLDFSMKVYSSHRKFPSSAVAALDVPVAAVAVPTVAEHLKRLFEEKGSKVEGFKEVRARKARERKAAKEAEAEAAASGAPAAVEVIEEGWRVVGAHEREAEAAAVAAALISAQEEVATMVQNQLAAPVAAPAVAVANGSNNGKKRKRAKKVKAGVAGAGAMDVALDAEQAAADLEDPAVEMLVVRNLQQKGAMPLEGNANLPPPEPAHGGARLELALNVRVMFAHTRAEYAPPGMQVSTNGVPRLRAGVQGIIRLQDRRKWCVQWFTEGVEAILYKHEAKDIYAIYSSQVNFDEERFFIPILE